MIFKLQRALNSDMVLVYNEDRTARAEHEMHPDILDELFGDELKVFYSGEVKDGNIVLKGVAQWQPW